MANMDPNAHGFIAEVIYVNDTPTIHLLADSKVTHDEARRIAGHFFVQQPRQPHPFVLWIPGSVSGSVSGNRVLEIWTPEWIGLPIEF